MSEKLETKKFVFTVEGETEQWYLEWLRDQINKIESQQKKVITIVSDREDPQYEPDEEKRRTATRTLIREQEQAKKGK